MGSRSVGMEGNNILSLIKSLTPLKFLAYSCTYIHTHTHTFGKPKKGDTNAEHELCLTLCCKHKHQHQKRREIIYKVSNNNVWRGTLDA